MSRKSDILISARRQFAERGFAGASLRGIAAEAQVSLTLLNHHYGSKADLLAAVDDACSQPRRRRDQALAHLVRQGAGTYSLRDLLATWVHSEFEVAALPHGDSQLRFLARLAHDGSEEARDIVARMDRSAKSVIDGFQGCFPQATRRAAASAFLFAEAAAINFLLSSRRVLGVTSSGPGHLVADEVRLLRYLESGIEAALAFSNDGSRLA